MVNKTGISPKLGQCFQQLLHLLGFLEWQIPPVEIGGDPDIFFEEVLQKLKDFSEHKKIVVINKDYI